ncbi:hypothetical protein HYC85_006871 [Camellia sinensis]|uniref:BZIP domain-containing protein n=1 Tax=Camellia sinensis TaxID=4442 RepID=A0A7J7HN72_CAMSI|nr:hypothetical protein HYC85_006871 [Camellia sinensis]
MVVIEPEIMSKSEVDSPLQSDQQPKNRAFPSLGRQSSIYSLTLDEFQHTLCESGKNFGSMNMDEFLNSIWTAEENQAQAQTNSNPTTTATNISSNNNMQYFPSEGSTDRHIARQLSLSRQGSLTLPPPLCRKTVDEVWLEIHQSQQEQPQSGGGTVSSNVQNPGSSPWQPTFGEMTLEDFLVRAGVVREQCNPILPAQHQQQPYRLYQNNNNPGVGPSFVQRSIMALGTGIGGGGSGDNSGVNMPTYQALPQGGVGGVGEPAGYAGNGKRSGGGYPPPPSTVCYGSGRVGNVGGGGGSGGGYGQGQGQVQVLGMELPLSPVSSDGMCPSQGDGRNQFGMDMGGMRGGRKRIIDGPVEKVVERRQRRMIKNRESAARSRARKQAYTVELEAELNQLKEENAQLKQTLIAFIILLNRLSLKGKESNR